MAESELKTGRIQALTDGVYAIAMTILILNFHVPKVAHTSVALLNALWRLRGLFFDFIISFLLLAIFWIVHHLHFQYIKRADRNLLWINIFGLISVIMIPFSTLVYGAYRELAVAAIFFELNILLLGLIKYVQWSYATAHHRLVDANLDQSVIDRNKRFGLVTPIVALAAIGAAFIVPDWSTSLFMLIPLVIRIVR